MDKNIILKLRELIRAEVSSGIAGTEEDEYGYRGNNRKEELIADGIFEELLKIWEVRNG